MRGNIRRRRWQSMQVDGSESRRGKERHREDAGLQIPLLHRDHGKHTGSSSLVGHLTFQSVMETAKHDRGVRCLAKKLNSFFFPAVNTVDSLSSRMSSHFSRVSHICSRRTEPIDKRQPAEGSVSPSDVDSQTVRDSAGLVALSPSLMAPFRPRPRHPPLDIVHLPHRGRPLLLRLRGLQHVPAATVALLLHVNTSKTIKIVSELSRPLSLHVSDCTLPPARTSQSHTVRYHGYANEAIETFPNILRTFLQEYHSSPADANS